MQHEPPIISDALLRDFANPTPDQQRGEYDDETRALLAIALPEICAELLRWRDTARTRPTELALALRSESILIQLDDARRIIRAEAPDLHDLTIACAIILRHSQDAPERDAAARVLGEMQGVAA